MPDALLDLADPWLQLWHGDTHLESPGYALFDQGRFVFGHEARQAARLRPRDVNTQFWWRLGTDPLQPSLGHARHTADIAHAHLNALYEAAGKPANLMFAVPGSMSHEQLSLLLGIAQQCPFRASGLVNRSVALASAQGGRGPAAHLEVQLHQALVYTIARDDSQCSLERQQTLPGCGLLQLQERLVETIAATFVRQVRFDPRRKAASEQALYDGLPGLLRTLQGQVETTIDIDGYQARIARGDLAHCTDRLREGVFSALGQQAGEYPVIIEPLTATLPGIGDWPVDLRIAGADKLYRTVQRHELPAAGAGEALSLVTTLPDLGADDAGGNGVAVPPAAPAPTHVLLGHRAHALLPEGLDMQGDWRLQRVDGAWTLAGGDTPVTVNGRAYAAGQPLAAGDVIGIGDAFSAQLIEVE